ncbi:FecR family protein, partial [Pedobacter sp.]|uniref:FecR family protein n=1 Tax=Pedobacter sp. TaxID=1411316 RepID=UPI003C4F264B
LSPQEQAIIDNWYLSLAKATPSELTEDALSASLNKIDQRLNLSEVRVKKSRRIPMVRFAAAASLIIISGLAVFIYTQKQPITSTIDVVSNKPDKFSGAVLQLTDGREISLAQLPAQSVIQQAGIQLSKTGKSTISYTINRMSSKGGFNILHTGLGTQYQVNLPDGTKVWLNSKSSLRFAVNFDTNQRKVELAGEAYFEVAKDEKKPFRVFSKGQLVEVLGTHFNINAYGDNGRTKTTLLEGRVAVSAEGDITRQLKPGQEATLEAGVIEVTSAKEQQSIAWKNGFFQFENASISTIMKELGHWYDLQITYHKATPGQTFSGKIPRTASIQQVLDILHAGGLKFTAQGNNIEIN